MKRLIRYVLIGFSLTVATSATFAQSNPYQGIYLGKFLVELMGTHAPRFCPSRMTVLPDEKSIIITTRLPNEVTTIVIRGSFNGNLFEGSSRGRMNVNTYIYSSTYKIRFVGNEARIEDVITPNSDIQNGVHTIRIFHKVRS
jgi:hypothetical protein